MGKKMALGKGIASLLQDTPNQILRSSLGEAKPDLEHLESNPVVPKPIDSSFLLVGINEIQPNPEQPRKIFRQEELLELAESIRENGVLQPLIVTKIDNGKYEIIAGERRFRAAKHVGLDNVPVVIRKTTKKEKMVFAIIENVQRDDLNCVEEALAYLQLISEFKLTQDEVAKKVGKSRAGIANLLRVLKLPRQVIESLQANKLSLGHAKVLMSLKDDHGKIINFAKKVIDQNLSVRDLEKLLDFEKVRGNSPFKHRNLDPLFSDKVKDLQKTLIDLTGKNIRIKTKGSQEKGSIEFKFSNKNEFNTLFDFLTLNSSDSGPVEDLH